MFYVWRSIWQDNSATASRNVCCILWGPCLRQQRSQMTTHINKKVWKLCYTQSHCHYFKRVLRYIGVPITWLPCLSYCPACSGPCLQYLYGCSQVSGAAHAAWEINHAESVDNDRLKPENYLQVFVWWYKTDRFNINAMYKCNIICHVSDRAGRRAGKSYIK